MRRRELMRLLTGAPMAWPLAAQAQLKAMPVLGFLSSGDPLPEHFAALRQGLSESGYIEGQNLVIEYRMAEGHYDRVPLLAADLVDRKVDVIVAIANITVQTVKRLTSTIPIVFAGVSDPVTAGLVPSLARPGGNLTGFAILANDLQAKRLQLLSELVPHAGTIALLMESNRSPNQDRYIREMQEAARVIGVELLIVRASTESEIDAAFATLIERNAGALLVTGSPFYFARREQILTLASRHAVPVGYISREVALAGGLFSYGVRIADTYRLAGSYAGKILNVAKPADLPVQQPTRFELVINLKTAKALGLTVPPSLLTLADEVIE